MKLSPEKFDELYNVNRLCIAIIGMSNVGKTRRAKSLMVDLKFAGLNADDLVEEKLRPFLGKKGFHDVDGVAAWMGQPYEARYLETQQLFVKFEEAAMQEINLEPVSNLVIDTTGSVIYLSEKALKRLKEKTLVVYLEASEDVKKLLFERYMTNPKPVVWGSSFTMHKGESALAALKRCYPQLLEYRALKYRELADLIIPHSVLRDASGKQFIQEVRKRLKEA